MAAKMMLRPSFGLRERPSADETGTTGDFRERPENNLDGCKKYEKPASHEGLYAWTDKK
jgi:hypothetical protein